MKTAVVFGHENENIDEYDANISINKGFIGTGRGNGKMKKPVEVRMMETGWIYKNDAGEKTSYKELVQVLGQAPAWILDTEFVKALIENFYEDQKKYLILFGFLPYSLYLGITMSYLYSSMKRQLSETQEEYEYDPAGFAHFFMLLQGMIYFIILEFKQVGQLKWDYLSPFNLIDLASLAINITFCVHRYTEQMSTSTMMKLMIVQIVLMWSTFVYWLRLFEIYVLFIQLIK